jgi:septum site-determining protein MinD
VYIHPSGIRLIPAPLNGDGVSLTKDKCCRLVNQVRDNYDIIILDCSPGLGKEAMTQIAAIDEALIVTTPDLPALTDAIKTAQLVSKLGKKLAGIVVNRYRNEKYELTAREISSTVNYDVVGTIPEDSRIPASISKGMPAVLSYPNTPASVAIKKLAARLVGAEYHEPGLIARLKQMLDFGNASVRKKAGPTGRTAPAESEVRDVQRLKEELTKEVKDELKRDIAKRVKKRLEGKT